MLQSLHKVKNEQKQAIIPLDRSNNHHPKCMSRRERKKLQRKQSNHQEVLPRCGTNLKHAGPWPELLRKQKGQGHLAPSPPQEWFEHEPSKTASTRCRFLHEGAKSGQVRACSRSLSSGLLHLGVLMEYHCKDGSDPGAIQSTVENEMRRASGGRGHGSWRTGSVGAPMMRIQSNPSPTVRTRIVAVHTTS